MINGVDQKFLNYAAEDNQAEIQLCLLAAKRATNSALKAFARLMVDDHVEIESRLAALGNELHADLPDGIGKEGEMTVSKLAPLKGMSSSVSSFRRKSKIILTTYRSSRRKKLPRRLRVSESTPDELLRATIKEVESALAADLPSPHLCSIARILRKAGGRFACEDGLRRVAD